eukprot:CAMPEP_0206258458 /NCGR_PEP_ID=MMETSP0047_2-20121206/25932_1 /ASSEMBLY_ACC=CAM_ASM_000192 /TAXON_ID=195065 /ORGANISM="Chroomonas mesostigmatica_cf, Strain CCMP1168" /LENGTH=34 /DNA_ID= /DNA_START= /DNA_END= /DNA_ORIENTATION=
MATAKAHGSTDARRRRAARPDEASGPGGDEGGAA